MVKRRRIEITHGALIRPRILTGTPEREIINAHETFSSGPLFFRSSRPLHATVDRAESSSGYAAYCA
jgi:hypothetical protein